MSFPSKLPKKVPAKDGDNQVIADKVRILRQLIETVMWQISSVKEGNLDELPGHAKKKDEILAAMEKQTWTITDPALEDPDVLILQSQAIDLEQQLQQLLENRMQIIASELQAVERRHNVWLKTINPYFQSMGGTIPSSALNTFR